jgi:hypothetical protein
MNGNNIGGTNIGGIGGIINVGDLSECNCFQINTDIRNLKMELNDVVSFVSNDVQDIIDELVA